MPWQGLSNLPIATIFFFTPWISHVQCAGIRTLETSSLFLRKHPRDYKRVGYTQTAKKELKSRIWNRNIEWNIKRQQDFPELQTPDHLKGKKSKACPCRCSPAIPHPSDDPSKFSGSIQFSVPHFTRGRELFSVSCNASLGLVPLLFSLNPCWKQQSIAPAGNWMSQPQITWKWGLLFHNPSPHPIIPWVFCHLISGQNPSTSEIIIVHSITFCFFFK